MAYIGSNADGKWKRPGHYLDRIADYAVLVSEEEKEVKMISLKLGPPGP